ncbi:hypothetical protein VaNZ11_000066 [Volvox africanus]|uniref:Uncharacterized protein n=1 Tax=Volvox africanus TaxID=51714 RepID=A0ABQ5RLC0_9CHLO|nr:hypothetical protein VaNZ11_000066 [Volvox africanus]
MSITAWDIKEAAFCSDVKDIEELILTNKGATDVTALSQAINLRSLSLAFNSLASLSGLAPLVRLQSLNVSHNQLASLKGLHALSCLVTLNASHNKVVSLAPLSGLNCLADLWIQNNCVAAPGELRVLAGLPGLQRLAIANNPLAKALPGEQLRLVALRLCPGLRVIDGRPVDQAERAASDSLDLEALLSVRPGAPGSAPATPPTLGSIGTLGSRPGSGNSATPSYNSDTGRISAGARPGRPGGRPSSGAQGLPDSRLPAAASRRRTPRSNSYDSLTGSTQQPGLGGDLGLIADDDAAAAALAAAAAALEASASSSSFASSGSFKSGGTKVPQSGGGRRPPLPGGGAGGAAAIGGAQRPAAQLQGTQFQAVLDALPRFDSSKLPTRYNGAPAKPRGSAGPVSIAKPPPDAHLVEYEAKYPAQRGGGKAVVVRRDGSAAAFWPGGDMAVTVDADYGSAYATLAGSSEGSSDGSGEADCSCGRASVAPVSYKMMVMYRAGGVAVSWDIMGGFVQYPSGGLMLIYSRSTGSGTCYSPSGEITRRWRDLDAAAAPSPPPVVTISLPFPLTSASPREPPPPPPAHVDMQLDPHLGVRFVSATHSLELYLSCETIRYRFRCGTNSPGDIWDPPPGRGDGGGGDGGGSVSGSRVQTPQHDSQPSTPSGTTTRGIPVLGGGHGGSGGSGGGGGAAGSEKDGGGKLQPPSFLRNLARQGGAGTHRPVGAAGGTKQGPSVAARLAAEDVSGAAGSASEGLAGIASITAGLQALDDGLQAWLSRDSKGKADSLLRTASSTGQCPPLALPSSSSSPSGAGAASPSPAKGRRTGGGSGVNAARALAAHVEGMAADGSEAVEAAALAALAAAEPGSSDTVMETGTGSGEAWPRLQGALKNDGSREGAAATVGGDGTSRGIDSDVAEQLAAARKLAADSLAAAMAAASAAALIGSSSA